VFAIAAPTPAPGLRRKSRVAAEQYAGAQKKHASA